MSHAKLAAVAVCHATGGDRVGAYGLSLGSLDSSNSIDKLGLNTAEARNEIFGVNDSTILPCVLGLAHCTLYDPLYL